MIITDKYQSCSESKKTETENRDQNRAETKNLELDFDRYQNFILVFITLISQNNIFWQNFSTLTSLHLLNIRLYNISVNGRTHGHESHMSHS